MRDCATSARHRRLGRRCCPSPDRRRPSIRSQSTRADRRPRWHAHLRRTRPVQRSLAGWVAAHTDPTGWPWSPTQRGLRLTAFTTPSRAPGRILALINQRLDAAEQTGHDRRGAIRESCFWGTRISGCAERFRFPCSGFRLHRMATGAGSFAYSGPASTDDPAWLVSSQRLDGCARKGAFTHPHRSLAAAVRGTVEGRSVPAGDVYPSPFLMCHIAGYNVLVRRHWPYGAAGQTVSGRRSSSRRSTPTRWRPACMAPTMLHALLPRAIWSRTTGRDAHAMGDRHYRLGGHLGGSDLTIAGTLGVISAGLRGMTETGGNVTFSAPPITGGCGGRRRSAAQRRIPHSGVEVAIDGTGTTGEVRSPGDGVLPAGRGGSGRWLVAHRGHRAARPDGSAVDRRSGLDVIITGGEKRQLTREVEDVRPRTP